MGHHRVKLLWRARRQGPVALLSQAARIVRDKLGYHRYLVFWQNVHNGVEPPATPADVQVRDFAAWDDVPPQVRDALVREAHSFGWDTQAWLSRGWRLWVALCNESLASASWTMLGPQCPGYFVPLRGRDGVLWWTVTLPEFRGRGLAPLLYRHMLAYLCHIGAQQAYVCCGDWNLSSRACIEKAGFTLKGVAAQNRRSRRVTWRPLDTGLSGGESP